MTPEENAQLQSIEALRQAVVDLARAFEATADVTLPEFQQISQARDDLVALVMRMYESCIYKAD
ncbi:MAG: hypothetical protein Q8M31_20915 [Beijerinckiaceae bacterium]|nr:hypothetical protein [Beijerinckiaceae bacterium]